MPGSHLSLTFLTCSGVNIKSLLLQFIFKIHDSQQSPLQRVPLPFFVEVQEKVVSFTTIFKTATKETKEKEIV